jgi:hypothetical protein
MKIQQAVTGRPMWQVGLMASIQRGQKRLKQSWVRVITATRTSVSRPCEVFTRAESSL